MKSSWYLLLLTALFLASQAIHSQPVEVTQPTTSLSSTIQYGPNRPWEWQLAKADYDAETEKRIQKEKEETEKRIQQATQLAWESQYCRSASEWTPPDAGAIGYTMAEARGWIGEQWEGLEALWGHESGWKGFVKKGDKWCVKFNYAGSGACGIPQALPCSKIPDPMSIESQLSWGMDYIAKRYGNPVNAKEFLRNNGWY